MTRRLSFWKGRRTLLTGHTGFKGGWLALWLSSMGAEVHGFSLDPPTTPNLFDVARVKTALASDSRGDITEYESVVDVIEKVRPEVLFHLAAQSLVRRSYTNPVETFSTNVMGTLHVLEAVRHIGGCVVINVTSDKCYENEEWFWGYRENDRMGGYDPYSSSKGCSELLTAAYRKSFFDPESFEKHGVALASVRAGNVIGGGDWSPDRLIPDIMKAFANKKPVAIRNPRAIRPWQHVLEPLNGYVLLAEKLCSGVPVFASAWNFGPDDSSTMEVSRIVDLLTEMWGSGAGWAVDNLEHAHEASYLKLDSSKARSVLGWRSCWSLKEALTSIVEWHRSHEAGRDMNLITLDQIHRFEESMES